MDMQKTAKKRRIGGLYNVPELAELAGVPMKRLYSKIYVGKIIEPTHGEGRRKYYTQDEVNEILEQIEEEEK